MNPDEAIKNLKQLLGQLRIDSESSDYSMEAKYYADKLESNLKVLEAAIIELKDKNEYWDRVRIKKDIRPLSDWHISSKDSLKSRLVQFEEWLHNG